MRVKEITHEGWQSFFDDFNQLHHGKHVNVETMADGNPAARSRLCDQPLVGIVSASDAPGLADRIEVIAGDSAATQAAFCVANPRHVWLGEENGWMVALQIESADGSVTMIRFEPPREAMPSGFTIA